MEALTVLRLNVSPRRNNNANALLEDDEVIALPTPYTSPPSSPRHAFSIEVEESPLGEVRAAIPFVWELIPGTPKDDFESQPVDIGVYSDTTEETGSQDHGLSEKLSRDSSISEFEFCSRLEGIVEPLPLRPSSLSTAGELFSNGQVVPLRALRLPPRLQAVKHLRYSDSSCSDVSSTGSFKSYHFPQSPPSPNVQNIASKLKFCGFMRTPESGREEVTILGMQEKKQRNRPSSLPAIDMHFKSSRKEHLGRVLFTSRFGMLCSCLGITPESP